MRLRVIWARSALADLDTIYEFIQADNPRAARRVIQQIQERGKSLAVTPSLGHFDEKAQQRILHIPNLPYFVAYAANEANGIIEIARVYHTRRRPLKLS